MTFKVRRARLRPEFAHLYPGIDPGVWEVAANVAERLLTRAGGSPASGGRVMNSEHFEFQGGFQLARLRAHQRTRWEDRHGGR